MSAIAGPGAGPALRDAGPADDTGRLERRDRRALALQRLVGAALAPLWFPVVVGAMRLGLGWRIRDARELRRLYASLRRSREPLLVCANHLTLVDSAVIAWALGTPGWFLRHYAALPWNVPERRNFASSMLSRIAVYVMKCVPIERGGDRTAVGRVFTRLGWLLERGEAVLIFPEGGRSRTGRVEEESAAYGVGRLVASVPGCRVLCVYLRGEGQEGVTDLPARGERFRARARLLVPVSEHRGMRRARDIAGQVVAVLKDLEAEHFGECAAGVPAGSGRIAGAALATRARASSEAA